MKPRLAESAEALWAEIQKLNVSGVVPPGGGVYYPTIRIVAGPSFVLDVNNEPRLSLFNGISTGYPTPDEIDDLFDAIRKDQVEVLILTRPGYESRYGAQQTKTLIHSPSGNSFQ